jgi:acetoin utilization deacetylase AcuC-like enzyme
VSTLLVTHADCLDHVTPLGHPERPDRVKVVERILEHERFMTLERDQAPLANLDTIALAHPRDYIDMLVASSPESGLVQIDSDTTMSPGSLKAALRSAGGAILAVDDVMPRKVRNAFVATRPPGHHAETAKPMGFCFFNNAAVAARHAQKKWGVGRVAIMDFDVHHGNGTQDIFWNDATVMYASTHEMPLYPGTGAMNETGDKNTIVNAPLRAGDGGGEMREAFEIVILPRMRAFQPDLVIISAGFDAHVRDPLANINCVEADFAWMTRKLMEVADECCSGRVVSLLEGGYDLEGLSRSVAAHVMTLMHG